MNDTINREESPLATFMAAVGLLVMIILLAWLAVQLVRSVPTVFSRLATVFEDNQRQLDDQTGDDNVVVVTDPQPNEESPSTDDEDEDSQVDEDNESEDPVYETPTPTATTPKPTPVQYKTVVTYKVPVSDPNGYTDLEATFAAVGTMNSGGRFVPASYLKRDERSALQFKVKNAGTKTSAEWHFTAKLPDGSTINSDSQLPLKPSETATIAVVFDGVESKSDDTATVSVSGGSDTNLGNNSFRVTIEVR